MIRSDRLHLLVVVVVLAGAGACGLPVFPDGEIACVPGEGGRPCPTNYSCVDPDGEGNRCFENGCGDGIVDPNTEQCDDANDNQLDRCDADCHIVDHVAVVANVTGLGKGDGRGTDTPMGRPTAITADLDGNLFVTSAGTNVLSRITRIDDRSFAVARIGGNGTMLGGSAGTVGTRPDTMSTTFATSLAVDGFGNLFLADFQDSVIRRVDAVTGLVDAIAGTGVTVPSVEDGVAGPLVSLNLPTGLAIDGIGAVFFAERGLTLADQRLRRIDPDTGVVDIVFEGVIERDIPGVVDELVFDNLGRLHLLGGRVTLRDRNPNIRDHFLDITTVATAGSAPVQITRTRSLYTHTTDANDRRLEGDLPGTAAAQGHAVTVDGEVFHVLMDSSVVRVEFPDGSDSGFGEIVATAPDVVTGDGDGGLTDGNGVAIPFSFKPTDLARSGDSLFIADPGNGVVWRANVGDEDLALDAALDHVVAGDTGGRGAVDTDVLVGDVATGFALESDGHVGVGSTQDCQPESPLSLNALEFMLAFPDAHRVLYSNCRNNIAILAGTGTPGFSGDNGRADGASLNRPTAMTRVDLGGDNDFFFIADRDNNRIRRLRNVPVGAGFELHIDTFIGQGSSAPGAAATLTLDHPTGLTVDDTRALLIADTGNHRVLRVDVITGDVTTIAGTGEAGFNGDNLTATATQLNEPVGLVFLPVGLVTSLTSPGAPAEACALDSDCTDGKTCISGFCTAPGGLLLVAERGGHRVRGVFVPPIRGLPEVQTLAGTGVDGDVDDITDGALGQLSSPRSLMFAIPDLQSRVLRFFAIDAFDRLRGMELSFSLDAADFGLRSSLTTIDGAGRRSRLDGPRDAASFRSPSGIAALDAGRFLVVDRATGRLRLIHADGRVDTVSGIPDGADVVDGPVPAAAALPLAGGLDVAVDVEASPPVAWVTEADAGRVRRFLLNDLAAPSTWTTDVPTFATGLGRPEGVTVDGEHLYVADAGNHVVLRITPADGSTVLIAGTRGVRGSVGDGRTATAALLNAPAGVAVRDGVVVIADTGNNRVRRIDPVGSAAGIIRTILGDGAPAAGGEGAPARVFPVRSPRGLTIDGAGNLIVTSGSALRFIGAGNPNRRERDEGLPHVADGDDAVSTIYGGAERLGGFPEAVTRCVDDVTLMPTDGAPTVVAVDSCVGLVLPLTRQVRAER